MRVLAIGDIHGCCNALDALLAAVAPTPDDVIVTLGDYVDRGPDTRGVIDRLLDLERTHRLIPLLGNHEFIMRQARHRPDGMDAWRNFGGEATLTSYGGAPDTLPDSVVPADHWEFFERCRMTYETETHVFAHSAIRDSTKLPPVPYLALSQELMPDHVPLPCGRVLICGHTAQKSGVPLNLGHTICIDTAVEKGQRLTCLDVSTGGIWQAAERDGVVTKGALPPPAAG